ncbi:hypothetical protein [Bacillus halotolerans]|uniref:Uncharacterized protein n=1 Tax=Bacillus halotolerans TaxID=260554 RepID=A0A9Q4EG99_9BACI|nr:hypothetical protein [Bacillus halotolerans]MCM3352640.1 hypothetical protein [Bacillus halotolerans]MCY9183809.1 hypothetical protein [Bacillus halotolerans]
MDGASFFALHTNGSKNLLTDLAQQESAAPQVDFKSYEQFARHKVNKKSRKAKNLRAIK